METKEQKVKDYINNRLNCKDCKYEGHCRFGAGYDGSEDCSCNGDDLAEAYEAGWDEALKSQWVKIDKGFPKEWQDVLMLHIKDGEARVSKATYIGDGVWVYGDVMTTKNENVVAWMPIPSFDEILNNNKDVLKRLKDR